jgi:SPP1 gp7 family putative phage head morphogenesis protein
MKSSGYWRGRAEILEEAASRRAGKLDADVQRQFALARKTLDEQIEQWYGRFARNNGITLAEAGEWLTGKDLAEFKWDVAEYVKHGREAATDPAFVRQLENASARFHVSKLEALKIKTRNTLESLYGQVGREMGRAFGDIYESGYHHAVYEVQRGLGVAWDVAAVSKGQVETALSKPWTADGRTFSDRIWKQKQDLLDEAHTRLTQNMMLGKAPDEAIRAIAAKFGASRRDAGRLVMTESAYFANAAQRKAFADLGVEEYEIVESLDAATCGLCGGLDGKVFPMAAFEAGVTAPPFHPFCRGCVAPYFADGGGERFARGGGGERYHVPAGMTYGEWRGTFVEGGDKSGLKPVGRDAVASRARGGSKNAAESAIMESVSDASNYAEYVEHMTRKFNLGAIDEDIERLDFASVRATTAGVERVMDEFPQLRSQFTGLGTTPNLVTASCTYGGEINFGAYCYSTPEIAANAIERQLTLHPANHSLEGVGIHEAGHLIEGYLIDADGRFPFGSLAWSDCTIAKEIVAKACQSVKRTPFGKGKRDKELVIGISRYAKTNDSEALAEAVEDWFLNGENANPLSREIMKIVKEMMK